jgi:hypothetical protein
MGGVWGLGPAPGARRCWPAESKESAERLKMLHVTHQDRGQAMHAKRADTDAKLVLRLATGP